MVSIVGIQLQKNGKIYYFDVNGLSVKPGDYVIADTARGNDLGEVVILDADYRGHHLDIVSESLVEHGSEGTVDKSGGKGGLV